MPTGTISVDKVLYSHWKPQRLATFNAFLNRGTGLTISETARGEIDFTLDHPDFTESTPSETFVLRWEKCIAKDYTYTEYIAELFSLNCETYKYTPIKKYSPYVK